jgi:hypothetical protein
VSLALGTGHELRRTRVRFGEWTSGLPKLRLGCQFNESGFYQEGLDRQ